MWQLQPILLSTLFTWQFTTQSLSPVYNLQNGSLLQANIQDKNNKSSSSNAVFNLYFTFGDLRAHIITVEEKWIKHPFSFSVSRFRNDSSGGSMLNMTDLLETQVTVVMIRCWVNLESFQFSSVQSLSHVWLFATPWIAARQASLSITNSWSSLKLKSIESVMPPNHLILCCPFLLLPPISPSIRVFSNESAPLMRSICLQCGRPRFDPWVGKISWRRKRQPIPVLLPEESHGWRSLMGFSPWGRKKSDTTERLHFHFHTFF